MLRFENVTKRFGGREIPALDAVSFEVKEGEVFGLLGHNGAGKSTAVGVLLGLVHANAGEVFVDGISVQKHRERALGCVGAIFETPCFYDYLSGWQNLRMLARYSNWWEEKAARETVELVGMTARIGDKVRTYSHGMRQRLALAQALLPQPKVLVLDEPMDGLDPDGMLEFREWISRLNGELGVTILLNSHLLAEVEHSCTRVAILREGKLVYVGSARGLETDRDRYRLGVAGLWDEARSVIEAAPINGEATDPGYFSLPRGTDAAVVVTALVQAGFGVRELIREEEGLEELYHRFRKEVPAE